MWFMKKFGSEYRLQADSSERVTKTFEHAVLDLPSRLKFQGRKLRPGPLINALVYWWANLSKVEREKVAQKALAGLEAMLKTGDVDDDSSARRGAG